MLDGLIDAIEVVTESLESACGTCSGRTPAPGPTGTGTATTTMTNQPGSSPNRDRSPGDRRSGDRTRPDRSQGDPEVANDPPSWDDPDYEWTLQRDNLAWRTIDVGMELAMLPFKAIGKLLGPIMTVVEATPAVTEGMTTVYQDTRGEGGRVATLDAIHELGQGRISQDDPRLGRIGGGR